ncbi:lipopolysaccharide transport system permease protein [Methylomarinovum caldicuralii]|uniref:Transport permease protein n=1 Tax=Methylomarinovum caldicuralii TaxID=438856 RepID=A0AAU9BXE2_9GAMM|nr:ABC transporter permease [Methylomarinovum caldicuralii]BCX80657.1 lipopolysaccharide transport system permease protein [Methylomarinovum caldicuralii]
MSPLRELGALRWALWQLLRRQVLSQFRGSVLGLGWLILEPAFLFALYLLVFGRFLQVRFGVGDGLGNFALYLWCGLVPYNSLQQAVLAGVGVLPGNRPLLIHTRFPGWMLPLVEVLASALAEGIGLAILMLGVVGYHGTVSPWWLLAPLLVGVRLALTAGLTWIASILAVFQPDFGRLLGLLLTLGFFMTPIIYPPQLVPESWRWLLQVNPFHWLVAAYRAVLIEGSPPPPEFWGLALGSLALAVAALVFFNRALARAKDFL